MTSGKKSFLLATFDAGGTVSPMAIVAAKLVCAGHRVRMMSDTCNRADAENAGATFTAWTHAPSKPARGREHELFHDWEAPSPPEGIKMMLDTLLVGAAGDYARDLCEELEREPADLVVSSDFLFGVHMACEMLSQPFALFTANISLVPVPGVPPIGPGLAPAKTEEERALHAAITQGVHGLFDSALPQFNALRAAHGLAPLSHLADQHRAAMMTLMGTSRAFDFAPEILPPHMTYVGPQLGVLSRTAAARTLYLRYSTYFAADLLHMAREEVEALPLYHAYFSNDELMAMEGRVIGSIGPERLVQYYNLMLPGMNPQERATFVRYVGNAAPVEALVFLRDVVAPQALPAPAYKVLIDDLAVAA